MVLVNGQIFESRTVHDNFLSNVQSILYDQLQLPSHPSVI